MSALGCLKGLGAVMCLLLHTPIGTHTYDPFCSVRSLLFMVCAHFLLHQGVLFELAILDYEDVVTQGQS